MLVVLNAQGPCGRPCSPAESKRPAGVDGRRDVVSRGTPIIEEKYSGPSTTARGRRQQGGHTPGTRVDAMSSSKVVSRHMYQYTAAFCPPRPLPYFFVVLCFFAGFTCEEECSHGAMEQLELILSLLLPCLCLALACFCLAVLYVLLEIMPIRAGFEPLVLFTHTHRVSLFRGWV